MNMTAYQAKYFAHELTKRCASDSAEKLAGAVASAQVDLNPHQVDAALFAFNSPFARGALLADEVGLGKTIEAGLVLAQKWAERKRRILVITPSNLRKQWYQEVTEKFFLPCKILEAKSYNAAIRQGDFRPFEANEIVICSYQFACGKAADVANTPWDLVVIDEAHRLRNVYKPANIIANTLKRALANAPKLLLTATPLQLRGVSVINGAQTIATSAQYQEEAAGNDISAARVFLTIIEAAAAGDFGKSITRARNHQNQVVLANFAALDDEQERLRRELASFGIHYAYKADAPDNTHNPLRIRIEEAAQALAMFQPDPRFAIWVRKEPMTLLDTESSRYRLIFGHGLKGLKLANAVRLNRYIQTRMTYESGRGPLRDRLIYRYGNFAISWVMAKQLDHAVEGGMLLDEVKIEATLSKPFDDTRQMLADAANKCIRGPLAVFRNQGEAIPVVKDLAIASYGLSADPVIAHKAAQSVKGEAYPKELFDYMISKAPQIGGLA